MALPAVADRTATLTLAARMILDLLPSFNAGELDPRMDARAGLDKYQAGCRTLKNFIPIPFGGASKRPGTIYKATLASSTLIKRLIPFTSTSGSSYLIACRVVPNFYSGTVTCFCIEVFQDGALVFSSSAGSYGSFWDYYPASYLGAFVSEAELFEFQFKQLNDIAILVHPNYSPIQLTHNPSATPVWKFTSPFRTPQYTTGSTALNWLPLRDENTDTTLTISPSAIVANAVTLTASSALFNSSMKGGFFALGWANRGRSADLTTNVTSPVSTFTSEWVDTIGTWNAYSFNYWEGTFEIHRTFDLTSDTPNFEVIRSYKGVNGTRNFTTGGSESVQCRLRLRLIGVKKPTTGADPHAVIEVADQRTWSLFMVTGYTSATAVDCIVCGPVPGVLGAGSGVVTMTIASPCVVTWTGHGLSANSPIQFRTTGALPTGLSVDTKYFVVATGLTLDTFRVSATAGGAAINTSGTQSGVHTAHSLAPTPIWAEGAWSDYRGYPRTIEFHQDRVFYGGNASEPLRLWASATGDLFNFRRTALADGSIAATISSTRAELIQWMASAREALVVGTSGREHVVTAPNDGVLAPNNLKVEGHSAYGSAYVAPVLVNYATLFLQRSKARVREFVFSQEVQGYVAPDMTRLSNILIQPGIKQWDLQRSLDTIVWGVTTDGKLIGMTYEREENVVGWHRHETDGLVESVAVIYGAEGASDEVYLSVKRTISGSPVRYLEVLDPSAFANQRDGNTSDLVLVDSAKVVTGAGLTTATGLSHLEGKTVQIVADGTRRNDGVVSGGSVAISGAAASKVVVGLAFEALLKPMKIEVPMRDGTAQMRHMKLTRLAARLWKSLGGEMRADDDATWEALGYPSGTTAFTGDVELTLSAKTLPSLEFAIRSNDPLPLTILALVPKFDVSGQ